MRHARVLIGVLAGVFAGIFGGVSGHAQTPSPPVKSRLALLRVVETHGQMENYLKLRALALGLPIPVGPPTKAFQEKLKYRQTRFDQWMQILAFRYTYDEVVRLQSQGLDLVEYSTRVGGYTSPEHMFAALDGIVIGEIIGTQWDFAPHDGHSLTAWIAVQEWLKGRHRSDTIQVRVMSGVSGSAGARASNDFIRIEGNRLVYPRGPHLFFVSQAWYPIHVAMQFGRFVPPTADFFLFTGDYATITGDSLQYHGPHVNPEAYPIKTVSQIRRLAERFPVVAKEADVRRP